jgi:4-hydroxybenzoate polyprenyltransferase
MSRPLKEQCLAWWQLLRIGNVFTAVSNVVAGFLIAQGGWEPVAPLLLLIATSALLYTAGMVLNDAFDEKLDAAERPERPIPSGRISRRTAFVVGWTSLSMGLIAACVVAWLLDDMLPVIVAGSLTLCIAGYDAGLKKTFLGPWTMGGCRLLNVMLGVSAAGNFGAAGWTLAAIVGSYTVGVSYFARSELKESVSLDHRIGKVIICGALMGLVIVPYPLFVENLSHIDPYNWQSLWIVVGVTIVCRAWLGRREASSAEFRRQVTVLLRGFILIDAAAAVVAAGWGAGLAVLFLLIPTWIASRFAPMT